MEEQPITRSNQKQPLHGLTLEMLLTRLVERYGWEELSGLIKIQCFSHEPSISSSLKFLRKTPWAREKVERLYLDTCRSDSVDSSENWPKKKV